MKINEKDAAFFLASHEMRSCVQAIAGSPAGLQKREEKLEKEERSIRIASSCRVVPLSIALLHGQKEHFARHLLALCYPMPFVVSHLICISMNV